MTERDEGLLLAARRARDIADKWTAVSNASLRNSLVAAQHDARAAEWRKFAEWCEFEANTYPGASRVLVV